MYRKPSATGWQAVHIVAFYVTCTKWQELLWCLSVVVFKSSPWGNHTHHVWFVCHPHMSPLGWSPRVTSHHICVTYFPIPKSLTEYSESFMPALSCPYNCFFISLEKIAAERLLAKVTHISQFLSPIYDRPTLDTTRVFLVLFSAPGSTMKNSHYTQFCKV